MILFHIYYFKYFLLPYFNSYIKYIFLKGSIISIKNIAFAKIKGEIL